MYEEYNQHSYAVVQPFSYLSSKYLYNVPFYQAQVDADCLCKINLNQTTIGRNVCLVFTCPGQQSYGSLNQDAENLLLSTFCDKPQYTHRLSTKDSVGRGTLPEKLYGECLGSPLKSPGCGLKYLRVDVLHNQQTEIRSPLCKPQPAHRTIISFILFPIPDSYVSGYFTISPLYVCVVN